MDIGVRMEKLANEMTMMLQDQVDIESGHWCLTLGERESKPQRDHSWCCIWKWQQKFSRSCTASVSMLKEEFVGEPRCDSEAQR